jgi:murein DD-endopeptidase MepM/ murein hydrolase activator NlpD
MPNDHRLAQLAPLARPAGHVGAGRAGRAPHVGAGRVGAGHAGISLRALALLGSLVLAASAGVRSGPAGAVGAAGKTSAATAYRLPLVGPIRVVRPFAPPATRYSAGHRGVDLASGPGGQVRAAGSGTVRFAGNVAGRGVVVLEHPGGISTEYEPLAVRLGTGGGPGGSRAGPGIAVRVGQPVAAGTALGVVAGVHGDCAPSACLHWGARRGGEYFDPLTLLQPLGPLRLAPTTSD